MKNTLHQKFHEIQKLCYLAIQALGISEGEFWVWFGHPTLLNTFKKGAKR